MNIRINDETNEKLKEIKYIYDLKNIDEAINLAIKNTPLIEDYSNEPPAFILEDGKIIVSWNDLKNSEIGTKWGSSGNQLATVLFKDDYGILIRFYDDTETFINYYNFLK